MKFHAALATLMVVIHLVSVGIGYAHEIPTALRIDGQRVPATLVDVDDRWRPRMRVDTNVGDVRSWSETELLRWGIFHERNRGRGTYVVLAGGSILTSNYPAIDAQQVEVDSDIFATAILRRENVRGLVLRVPVHAGQRDVLLSGLAGPPRDQDVIELANGDRITGRVVSLGQVGEALFRDVSNELHVAPGGGKQALTIPVTNVVSIALSTRAAPVEFPRGAYALVGMRDGSRLWISRITRDGSQVRLALRDGETLVADEAAFWPAVVALQMFGEHVVYLSDLATVGYKHIPFLSTAWDYGRDRNILGGMLRVGGCIFPKGLGMHSTSRLAYQLDNRFRRFEAEAAVDDVACGHGSVLFRVLVERPAEGNSSSAWEVAFESPIVRGGDKPLPVSVDVSRASRLALVVDFADRGDEGDHADWLDARLIR